MTIEYIKLYLNKYRKLIFILLLIILATILPFAKFNKSIISLNSTEISVIGTLFGAIIGGFFSLSGSIIVTKHQAKAQFYIKRKNLIYRPLYDELVIIHNEILKDNPYPNYISFENHPQTMLKYPQYTAWGRIKNDSRYLEVPTILEQQMEQLYRCIELYQKQRSSINQVIQTTANSVLQQYYDENCKISNIGSIISHDILLNKLSNFYNSMMCIGNSSDCNGHSAETINNVNVEIIARCNTLPEVQHVRDLYANWINQEKKTINLLKVLIQTINIKYES